MAGPQPKLWVLSDHQMGGQDPLCLAGYITSTTLKERTITRKWYAVHLSLSYDPILSPVICLRNIQPNIDSTMIGRHYPSKGPTCAIHLATLHNFQI